MDNIINILIIEDDTNINKLLCDMLSNSGYKTIAAYSGTEALLYIQKYELDMILLDLILPGISGEELLIK
jgi:two-component system OmpR family response regulator